MFDNYQELRDVEQTSNDVKILDVQIIKAIEDKEAIAATAASFKDGCMAGC